MRIICSRLRFSALGLALERFFFVLNLGGRFRGGLVFWRGRVFAGGVHEQRFGWRYAYKYARKHGLGFAEMLTLGRLAVRLPAHAKGGGGAGSGGVEGSKSGKEGGHGSYLINRARGRVVVTRAGAFVKLRLPLCQLVVDGSKNGKLHLPIAVA